MTSQQILHEVGLLILGASAIHFTQTSPTPEPYKRLAVVGLAFVTLLSMAGAAGVV
jgi:hypothetical protein